MGLSKAQQRYWVLADGLAVVGRRRSARELAARTSRIHEVSLHFLLFSCVNVLKYGLWTRGTAEITHRDPYVPCVCTCDPCVSRIPPGALRGTPPVFLNGVRLDSSEADRKAAGPKHDRSMRLGQREQGPGALPVH